MKVLFVSAGGKDGLPKVVVRNQGISLEKQGIEMRYFCVNGHGLSSYLHSIPRLKKEIRNFRPAVVHAHYSFSGLLASLAGARPLVVSLMGSDTGKKFIFRIATRFSAACLWDITVVKNRQMKQKLKLKKALIIPNGVDTDLFTVLEKQTCFPGTILDPDKKNILFVADPGRPEKNFDLAQKAVRLLKRDNIRLVPVYNIPNNRLPEYYNSADMLLMTSLREGSPNVVKEAMACNLPVVSTDVGDVSELLDSVKGCHICTSDPADVAEKIRKTIHFQGRSDGRERIFILGLDSATVARRLTDIYKQAIGNL